MLRDKEIQRQRPWFARHTKLICCVVASLTFGVIATGIFFAVTCLPFRNSQLCPFIPFEVLVQGTAYDTTGSTILFGEVLDTKAKLLGTVDDGHFSFAATPSNGLIQFYVIGPTHDNVPQVVAFPALSGVTQYTLDVTVPIVTLVLFNGTVGLNQTAALPNGQNITFDVQSDALLSGEYFFKYVTLAADQGPGLLESTTVGSTGERNLQSGAMFYFDIIDDYGYSVSDFEVKLTGSVQMADIPGADAANFYEFDPLSATQTSWTTTQSIQSGFGDTVSLPNTGILVHPLKYGSIDRNYPVSCVITKVVPPSGKVCSGASIRLSSVDGVSTSSFSGSDGSSCIEGVLSFNGYLLVGGTNTSVTFPSTSGTCANPSSCKTVPNLPSGSLSCT